jgi:hypothetical protein
MHSYAKNSVRPKKTALKSRRLWKGAGDLIIRRVLKKPVTEYTGKHG